METARRAPLLPPPTHTLPPLCWPVLSLGGWGVPTSAPPIWETGLPIRNRGDRYVHSGPILAAIQDRPKSTRIDAPPPLSSVTRKGTSGVSPNFRPVGSARFRGGAGAGSRVCGAARPTFRRFGIPTLFALISYKATAFPDPRRHQNRGARSLPEIRQS